MHHFGLKLYLTLYSTCSTLFTLRKKKYYFYVNLTLCVIFFLVLPKFDVMITTPLYYSLREEDVSGIVTAK